MTAHALQPILDQYFTNDLSQPKLPWYQVRALGCYQQCRTAALGGRTQYCERGHSNGVWYNSCRTRGCPQCQSKATQQWLNNTQRLLLSCPHHHIIFTVLSELNDLWRYNRARINNYYLKLAKIPLNNLPVINATSMPNRELSPTYTPGVVIYRFTHIFMPW